MSTQLDLSAFIAERTRDFTGCQWVFAEIDRWQADVRGERRICLPTGGALS